MNDTDNQPLEVMAPSAMMSIERAQIDSQVATAKQYPRNLADFRKRAVSMATLDAETSEACIYCRPVGKGEDGKQKFAEGPSIRMAEIIATCYGNIRIGARIVEQTPRYVKCEGAAHDLETNFAAKAEVMESTVDRNGKPYSERQAALMAKVAVSKAFRDAAFRVVPRALMKPVMEECRKVIAKQVPTVGERLKRIQAWISTLKISEKRVFVALGVTDWSQFTEDHFNTLTGLKTAIADGDRIDDVFPPLEEGAESKPNAPAPTAHQQATAPKPAAPAPAAQAPAPAAEPEAKKRGRPAGSKNAAPPAEVAPQAQTPAPEPAAQQETPPEAQPEAEDPELAAMGLAPEKPAATEPEPQSEEPAAPAVDALPEPAYFDRTQGEADDAWHKRVVTGLNKLMGQAEIAPETFMKWAIANKQATAGQKIADLSTTKLSILGKNWTNVILPKLKSVPA